MSFSKKASPPEAQATAPEKTKPYSQKQLRCGGRACARWGDRRDWYWRCDDGNFKSYKKRDDVTCRADDYDDTGLGDEDAHDRRRRYYRFSGDGSYDDCRAYYHFTRFTNDLCQCDDNRS